MKTIFDAIRKHFAHKPHGFRESHPLRKILASLERDIRGFSSRLDTITGLKPLSESDQKGQANLRDALRGTISSLAYFFSRQQTAIRLHSLEEEHEVPVELMPILQLPDTSGYMRTSAMQALRNLYRSPAGNSFCAELDSLDYENGTLSYRAKLTRRSSTGNLSRTFFTATMAIRGTNLDTLEGASHALLFAQRHLDKWAQEAESLPAYKAALAQEAEQERADKERDARIRAALKTLPAADRTYLSELCSGPYAAHRLREYLR